MHLLAVEGPLFVDARWRAGRSIVFGLGALAVPVFGAGEGVVASIGLLFPSHLVPGDEEAGLLATMHHAARRISGRLGATIYPFGEPSPLLADTAPA